MRKILIFLLAALLCVGLIGCSAGKPAELKEDVAILYTNDIHSNIDKPLSYDVLAGIKSELSKTYSTVLLLDAGDHIQGTAFGSFDKGESIISLMNAAGYDAATPGNHEFDYDMEGRIHVTDEWSEYPYLSCTFYHEEQGTRKDNVFDSYKIFSAGKAKIAVVGITTPESITSSTPTFFMDDTETYIYGVSDGEDGSVLYSDVQKAIDSAKAEGAGYIILLGHLGVKESSAPWRSEDVISHISGANALIDGHSHHAIEHQLVADKDGKEVVLTQTGEYFSHIGMMVLHPDGSVDSGFIDAEAITEPAKDADGNPVLDKDGKETFNTVGYRLVSDLYKGAEWPVDETVKALKDEWISAIDAKFGTVIGNVEIPLDNYAPDGTRLVRSQETNSGDIATDALYYVFDSMGLDVDAAIINGGGVRNTAIQGEFTYKTAKNVHPFGNVACLQQVTGQQLLDALEWGAKDAGSAENGGFLQVSGITFRIDASWPTSVQADDKGVWVGAPTGGYRVTDVKVYNKETNEYEPLDLEATYNLAGFNYTLRSCGDGFNMFFSSVNVLDYVMEDYMILATYIQAFDDGVVTATNSPLLAKYPNMLLDYSEVTGSGRIVIE